MFRHKSPSFVLGIAVLLGAGLYAVLSFVPRNFDTENHAALVGKDADAGAVVVIAALTSCRAQDDNRAQCFQDFFTGTLVRKSLEETASVLEQAMNENAELRLDCHQIVHAFGRAAFNKIGDINDVFREGTSLQICAGGFFHGAIEALFRPGDEQFSEEHITVEEMREKIPTLCGRFEELGRESECIHGIGHGAVYLLGYNIGEALETCDVLKANERFSCYTGVFMENLLAVDSELRMVSDGDRHAPCSGYEETKYRNPCYYVHSFRLRELGLSNEEIVRECRNVEGFVGSLCVRGFAIFHLAHEVLAQGPEEFVAFCESLDKKDGRVCAEGIASRLAAHTRDGSYAMPFCALFESSAFRVICFEYTADVLRVAFNMSVGDVRKECDRLVPEIKECYSVLR